MSNIQLDTKSTAITICVCVCVLGKQSEKCGALKMNYHEFVLQASVFCLLLLSINTFCWGDSSCFTALNMTCMLLTPQIWNSSPDSWRSSDIQKHLHTCLFIMDAQLRCLKHILSKSLSLLYVYRLLPEIQFFCSFETEFCLSTLYWYIMNMILQVGFSFSNTQ